MMRKEYKFILFTILAVFISVSSLLSFYVFADQTVTYDYVFDKADLLNDEEEKALSEKLTDLQEESDVYFIFASYLSIGYYDRYTGDDLIAENPIFSGKNAVILTVTLEDETFYYDMYTFGDTYDKISDKEVDYILDHEDVYHPLKSGDIASGADVFFDLSAKACKERIGLTPYSRIIIACTVISLIASLIVCICIIVSYKKKLKSAKYPLDKYASLNLKTCSDIFIGSNVVRVPIPRSDSSSGGGRGGGRGGGGGHRGGR